MGAFAESDAVIEQLNTPLKRLNDVRQHRPFSGRFAAVNNRHLMFHQLSRQGRQSIVMTIRRARIVTPFLRGEISRVAYTQQRGEDHF
jgi:hypothetical protein